MTSAVTRPRGERSWNCSWARGTTRSSRFRPESGTASRAWGRCRPSWPIAPPSPTIRGRSSGATPSTVRSRIAGTSGTDDGACHPRHVGLQSGCAASLVRSVSNQVALTRACLDSLRLTTEPFQLVVIDNGSTDETPRFFERYASMYPLRFARNPANESVIVTLNRAWRMAETEFVCILHNDTEFPEPQWLSRLLGPFEDPETGITGLYGVKRLGRNGRVVGRTIWDSLAEGPTVRSPREE